MCGVGRVRVDVRSEVLVELSDRSDHNCVWFVYAASCQSDESLLEQALL